MGIICGGGQFPAAVADSIQRQGRPVFLFLLEGFADQSLMRFPHAWIPVGALSSIIPIGRKAGCQELVMIGNVVRPRLFQIVRDWRMIRLLPVLTRIYLGGDNRLLSGVAGIFESQGFKLRGAHEVAPHILVPEGIFTTCRPSEGDLADIHFGFRMLHALGAYDAGQAAAIAGRRVLAVEAAEGTSDMLARVAEMRRTGRLKLSERAGVLVKCPKPGQDRRIDLPAIGPATVNEAKAAGLKGIAVEVGGAIVADSDALIAAANDAGIFVIALVPDAEPAA